MSSRISKRFCRQFSQEVFPWNEKLARAVEEPAFAAREAFAELDARAIARTVLAMDEPMYRAAFRGSPMTRAKLAGLRRNAAVVLGNIGTAEDVPALAAALDDPEPLVRAHVAWALGRIGSPPALEAVRARAARETEPDVASELHGTLARETTLHDKAENSHEADSADETDGDAA